MVFEKHVCWKPENFRKIVHTEAEASPDNVFLSVHTDNQLTLEKIDGTTHKITYREFLEEFLSDTYGNNVSSVIEGESGAGKSHLVQWLRLHIPETENRYVLTIPKSQTNLYSVLKMLIEMLPQDKHNEFTSKLEQRDTELTNDGQRVHVLLNSLATSIITDQAENEDEEYLIPLLPKIFTDPYFRDTFFPNNSLVKKLISLIFLDSSTNRNLEDRQEFRYEDLPLNAVQATHAAKPTREILDAMNDEGLLEISLEIINRNLDKAISKSLNFTPNDLIELMYEIRKYLGTQNKELVLLIEDFAQLQGLDTSLLQTLTVEGNQNLCQIRWAMAVTTGYYEKLEDTLRTRMVLKINMDNLWDSSSQEKQENYIVNLSSKYLNAIRLGLDDIENWFENYDIKTSSPKILNKCDECALKIDCHESFGEVDGVGLYPFNSISLIQMARKADVERFNTFRPRIFLNKVLHRNLNQKSVELLQNGAFPDQNLLKDFSIKRLGTEELHKLEILDPLDYLRRRTLLEIWSNSFTVVNLNEGIHKAFNIKQLADLNEISSKSPLLIQKQEIELVQKQESSLVQETVEPTNKLLEAIENWGKGHDLRDGEKNQIAKLVYTVLDSNIQWDLLPVAKSLIKFQAGQIYFENQQTSRPRTGIVLDIKCSTENAIVLKSLYLMNQNDQISDNIDHFVMFQNKIESWKKYIEDEVVKYFSPKVNWDPFEAVLELIILENIISNRDFSTKNLLLTSELPNMFSNDFGTLIQKVYGNSFKERILTDILKRTYTGRKGGSITEAFFDINKIQKVFKELRKNSFILKQDPTQEDRTNFDDIKNRYQIWKDNFENALTQEILVRVNLLEKIDDKVSIEDIGQSFRNKVENLKLLLQNSGFRSHTSNNLNSLLKCNLKQAKESFLSINKLTSVEQENALIELFPTRKNETLEFVKLVEEIDIFLNKVEENTNQMFIEHKQTSDISGVIEEIDIQINSIENGLNKIIGDK